MTLILRQDEVQGIISMREAVEAVEVGLKDWSQNLLLNGLRRRIFAPSGVRTSVHQGAVPSAGVTGLLIHCERLNVTSEEQIQDKISLPVGVLYDSSDASLLALIMGAVAAKEVGGRATSLRTAATSAVGTKYLAREDASSLGILGSGVQAKNHLVALTCVRPIRKVKVYSRSPQNREEFAVSMRRLLAVEVKPVDSPEEAVKESEMVLCATNSSVPVLMGRWLEPGMHVISIVGSDKGLVSAGYHSAKRREVDDDSIRRADLIVVNSVEQIRQDEHADIYDTVSAGIKRWEEIHELPELLNGVVRRTRAQEITLFKNNAGLGVADVAILAKVYKIAKEKRLGLEVPTMVLPWEAR
jgi:alanine dehydrogenase